MRLCFGALCRCQKVKAFHESVFPSPPPEKGAATKDYFCVLAAGWPSRSAAPQSVPDALACTRSLSGGLARQLGSPAPHSSQCLRIWKILFNTRTFLCSVIFSFATQTMAIAESATRETSRARFFPRRIPSMVHPPRVFVSRIVNIVWRAFVSPNNWINNYSDAASPRPLFAGRSKTRIVTIIGNENRGDKQEDTIDGKAGAR